jgi:hypothetical protein
VTDPNQPRSHGRIFLFAVASTPFHIAVVALWNLWWLYSCSQSGEWHWFMRSGAVTVVVGAVVSFRNVLRLTRDERVRFRNMNVVEVYSDSEKIDQERDSAAVIIGVAIMIAGTAVAAYGDLFGRIGSAFRVA